MKYFICLLVVHFIACKSIQSQNSETLATNSEASATEGKTAVTILPDKEVFGVANNELLVIKFISSNRGDITDWEATINLYLKTKAKLRWNQASFIDSYQEKEDFLYKTKKLVLAKNEESQKQFFLEDGNFIVIDGEKLNHFFNITKRHENFLRQYGTQDHLLRTYIKDVNRKIIIDLMEDDYAVDDPIASTTIGKADIDALRNYHDQIGYIELEGKYNVKANIGLLVVDKDNPKLGGMFQKD